MHNKKIKNKYDGWLCIDKPQSFTSTDIVNKIKHIIKPIKIGHAGTLDPFATGMLLIALGEATKTVPYAMDNTKVYEFTIIFGEERDSLDIDGKVLSKSSIRPSFEDIIQILPSFLGEQLQLPPKFSALKINGVRAYTLARNNIEFEVKPRLVKLNKIKLIHFKEDSASFSIECGKGFYVRSLARDICNKIGVLGYVSELRRLSIGKFNESDMISLDCFEKMYNNNGSIGLNKLIRPVSAVLDDILVRRISEGEVIKIKAGQAIFINDPKEDWEENNLVATFFENKLIAICKFNENTLIPKRVFNLL